MLRNVLLDFALLLVSIFSFALLGTKYATKNDHYLATDKNYTASLGVHKSFVQRFKGDEFLGHMYKEVTDFGINRAYRRGSFAIGAGATRENKHHLCDRNGLWGRLRDGPISAYSKHAGLAGSNPAQWL